MMRQLTDTIIMVSPDSFASNPETAESNVFQNQIDKSAQEINSEAIREFNSMAETLRANGVNVIVLSNKDKNLPDAVFPNNWFSTHEDGTLVIYPMLSPLRRKERDDEKLSEVLRKNNFGIKSKVYLNNYEHNGLYLEGTGSIVLDRVNNIAYAIESARTNREVFDMFCHEMNINTADRIFFHANDRDGIPIYHTNVIMSVGNGFAVICDGCIPENERGLVLDKLLSCSLKIITINYDQLYSFCGNILNLKNSNDESLIVMSETSRNSFTQTQISQLEKFGKIISVDIDTIERIGGGSARCMIAEIFLQLINKKR